jgi:uncharacterized membrane protein YdjX (TVP38/TMEM64 family)
MIHEGLKVSFLLRLSPIIPYCALNYLSGISSISFTDYSIAVAGTLPRTIVYTWIGTTVADLSDITNGRFKNGNPELILLLVGSVIGLIGIIYTTIVVRKYIEKSLIN